MSAAAIREALLHAASPSLKRRRRLTWLGALGLVDAAIMSLYQMGAVRHLPDPPGFDSDHVVGSRAAYFFGAPDAPLNALSLSATLILAGAGGSRASGRRPMFDVLLGASVLGHAAGALFYLWDMIAREKKACAYCIPALLINLSLLPLGLAEIAHSSK